MVKDFKIEELGTLEYFLLELPILEKDIYIILEICHRPPKRNMKVRVL